MNLSKIKRRYRPRETEVYIRLFTMRLRCFNNCCERVMGFLYGEDDTED